jgi:capsular exopolysaccharide synthesis family protein
MPRRPSLERPLAAIRRYKYLMIAIVLLATVSGFAATRLVKPKYEVRATIWIASETPLGNNTGPIRSHELLAADAWVELLRSYRISDAVVRKMALYVKPEDDADSLFFRNFSVADRFVPGNYGLQLNRSRKSWKLSVANIAAADSGAVGDSIGRKLGLRWQVSPAVMAQLGDRKLAFTISTPRETSVDLMRRLNSRLAERSNFLWLTLQDRNPELAARTLNTWVNEYVAVAAQLKKRNLVEFADILSGQLQYAESSLRGAETALESFRINTITLPNEGGPVAPGLMMTRDPVLRSFFDQKIELDNLQHDREALENVLKSAGTGTAPYEAALLIPSVAQSPGAEPLRESFKQLYQRQAELAAARQVYTDQFPAVRDLNRAIEILKTQTIPQQGAQLLLQLKGREGEFDKRIASASQDLQQIPARTIEEMRLRRAVMVAEGLYTTLKARYAEAKLAEASALPDVNVLDSAIAPLRPTKNTAPGIMMFAVAAGLGAAVGLALLLDRVDDRLRYPEQATDDLGLVVAGAVPIMPKGGVSPRSAEQVAQLIESFRTVRMSVLHSLGSPVSLAISSPSPGDGKSFVAANLAMSFADSGFRTLLVDGDTRRGSLHDMFGVPRSPGLTDHLAGEADSTVIVLPTGHDKLFVLPSGLPRRQSPELLTSPLLGALVSQLRDRFDVVIFDTPPLAAGIDGYAIAAATGSILVVLRVGQTKRRMAAAKLLLVDRLPIAVVGTVLNAVPSYGEFEYYAYADGYEASDEPSTALAV